MARTKGAIGKLNKDMKEVIHLAFQRAGGIDYLVRQAEAEPKAFMGLLGKIVPNENKRLLILHNGPYATRYGIEMIYWRGEGGVGGTPRNRRERGRMDLSLSVRVILKFF